MIINELTIKIVNKLMSNIIAMHWFKSSHKLWAMVMLHALIFTYTFILMAAAT